jgi:ribosome maturation factor RimP
MLPLHLDLEKLTTIAESVASSFGLELLEVKAGQQGKRRTIEITIYRRAGRISLDDCEQVSRSLEEKLDQQSPPLMDSNFLLEVQSPGIDRKLSSEREFSIFSGQPVEVKTKEKVEGLGSDFTGKLVGLTNGRVLISQPQKVTDKQVSRRKTAKAGTDQLITGIPEPLEVEMSNVIQVRLHPEMSKVGEGSPDSGMADSKTE